MLYSALLCQKGLVNRCAVCSVGQQRFAILSRQRTAGLVWGDCKTRTRCYAAYWKRSLSQQPSLSGICDFRSLCEASSHHEGTVSPYNSGHLESSTKGSLYGGDTTSRTLT